MQDSYKPLKKYIAAHGGPTLRMHGKMLDRLTHAVVEEWPVGCPIDRIEEVVVARMRVRLRAQYGSVIAMFLIGVLVNALVRIIIDWWLARESHKILMAGWAQQAQGR
jgi:hypothetical protein